MSKSIPSADDLATLTNRVKGMIAALQPQLAEFIRLRQDYSDKQWQSVLDRITPLYNQCEMLLPDEELPDGPLEDALGFTWNGEVFYGLTRKAWKLLVALWPTPGLEQRADDLAMPVWDTDPCKKAITLGQLYSAQRAVNKFLDEHTIPFRVSVWHGEYGSLLAVLTRNG